MGRILTPGGQPQQQIQMGVAIRAVNDQVAIAMTWPETREFVVNVDAARGMMELLRQAIVAATGQQIDLGINGDGSGLGLGQ